VGHDSIGSTSTYLIVDTLELDETGRIATLNVYNNGSISGDAGDHLIILSRTLVCHADPNGADAGTTSITADANTAPVNDFETPAS
jgi:hypothetical protein